MKPFLRLLALSVATGTLLAPAGNARAQLLITGNDEKVSFDETGKTVTHPPGKDTVPPRLSSTRLWCRYPHSPPIWLKYRRYLRMGWSVDRG